MSRDAPTPPNPRQHANRRGYSFYIVAISLIEAFLRLAPTRPLRLHPCHVLVTCIDEELTVPSHACDNRPHVDELRLEQIIPQHQLVTPRCLRCMAQRARTMTRC